MSAGFKLLIVMNTRKGRRLVNSSSHALLRDFMGRAGFVRVAALGKTAYGGHYTRAARTIIVNPKSGQGDVVGAVGGRRVIAECKGGTINTSHAGQKSRLRKGLSELIGQLMILDDAAVRQVAVLPHTAEVERLARRLGPRCAAAGIEIALVSPTGDVAFATVNA